MEAPVVRTFKDDGLRGFALTMSVVEKSNWLPPAGQFLNEEDCTRVRSAVAKWHNGTRMIYGDFREDAIGALFRSKSTFYRFYGIEWDNSAWKWKGVTQRVANGKIVIQPMPKNYIRSSRWSSNYDARTWSFLNPESAEFIMENIQGSAPRPRARDGNDAKLISELITKQN
jgi:hypothetical protein